MRLGFILVAAIAGIFYAWHSISESRKERDEATLRVRAEEARIRELEQALHRTERPTLSVDPRMATRTKELQEKISLIQTEVSDLDAEIARKKNAGIDRAANGNLADRIRNEKKSSPGSIAKFRIQK